MKQINFKNGAWGVVEYEIIDNQNLMALWTHNKKAGEVFTEIARRKNTEHSDVDGKYEVTWIEDKNKRVNGILIISKNENDIYEFRWHNKKGKAIYLGIGLRIQNKLLVIYT